MWRFCIVIVLCLLLGDLEAASNVNVRFCTERHSSTAQQWEYNRDDHTIRPLHSRMCLTTHKNQSSVVSITECVSGLNFYQVWSLNPQSGELTALNGKCLGVHYRQLLKSSVELTPCTGRANQHWIWKNINGGILQVKRPWSRCLTALK